ncbi:hypothetical protein [Pantoea vagans]|uniref:hypothetical protein n=1 Tax=Pantoea vagans TaxID=470934 RepID=UPI00076B092B|nr:hypothetical protein [Pantoea vagans]AMG57719.1 hypothetical protein AL522_08765 [Pantoea vagans]
MSDDEIYQKLKSGEAPRYIKGIEGFDDSELVQWMASYHEEVKSELLEALQEMVAIVKKHTYPQPDKPSSTWGRMEAAEAVIARAFGQ